MFGGVNNMHFIRNLVNLFRNSNHQSKLKENAALLLEDKNIALRNLLMHARKHSPWYRKILKNISIDTFTHEHLLELPTLTKSTLMENWDDIVTDQSLNLKKVIGHLDKMSNTEEPLPLDNKYLIFSTGGSTGKKGIFVYDFVKFKNRVCKRSQVIVERLLTSLPIQPGEKLKTAQVVAINAVHIMYVMSKIYNHKDEIKYYFPVTRPKKEIIEGLNKLQPHRIIGLPSTIHFLCKSAQSGELIINPRIISVGAEPLYEPIRDMIYQIWPKINLFNAYGATEGVLAGNCKPNSCYMHLYDYRSIFFPVSHWNQAVKVGGYCDKLIFTNLSNFILPLINYELEDRIRFIPEPCSCGSSFPVIEEPKGRSVDDFVYPGNITVHYLNFSTPLLLDGYVVEFHVMQTVNGVKINLVSNGPVKKQKIINSIRQSFTNLGLHNAQIEIVDVPNIDYLPSGKLRRFTPLNMT